MKSEKFLTERLILRLTNEEDGEFIFELYNSPKFLKYIGDRGISSVNSAKDYIKSSMLAQYERLGYSSYTIIRESDNSKIGVSGLYDREGLEGIDIGFALLPDYEGKGYAFEATNRLKEIAFNSFGLNEILGVTSKMNIASQKMLRKLGLEEKGTIVLEEGKEESLLYVLENK